MAVLGSLAAFGLTGVLAVRGARGAPLLLEWAPELLVAVSWRLDPATLSLAALVSGIGAVILHYAGGYFEPGEKASRTIATLALFESAMLGLVLSDNLFLLFVFWELTGLCSFFLIATDADRHTDASRAARQALLVTVAGGLPMLVGFLYLALQTGTASLATLRETPLPAAVQTLAFALILPGVLSKSAQVPVHFWLPAAMAAPTPVSAYLHSATMVKAGIILLLFIAPLFGSSWLWSAVLVPVGAATSLWGSYRALAEDDVKLLMAWSTVAQLGLLVLTIGLGTDPALRAAVLHLFAHALFKGGLFLSVGAIDHAAHTRRLSELGGLAGRAPLLAAAAAVCAASMAGLPPTVGFLSKELVLEEALHAGGWVRTAALGGLVLGSAGTVAYTARFAFGVFAGEARSEAARSAHAPGGGLLVGPALLATLALLAGSWPAATGAFFLEPIAQAVAERPSHAPPLALWHGLTAPLFLSAGIVLAGLACHRVIGLRRLPVGSPGRSGPVLFDALLDGSQRLGEIGNRWLSTVSPRLYFGLALALGFLGALPVLGELPLTAIAVPDLPALVVILVQALAIVGLLRLEGRLTRALLLAVLGFSVAVLYRLMRAPDLVLTQVLVEVVSTVVLVLAVRLLPKDEPRPGPGLAGSGLRLAAAVGAGLASAAVALALFGLPADARLKEYFFEAGPAIARGTNLVNVILVDFRGLDTLVETMVVVLAALGVAGLFLGWESRSREGAGS